MGHLPILWNFCAVCLNAPIKAQTRHRSDVTLLKYIRDAELFDDNAADLL